MPNQNAERSLEWNWTKLVPGSTTILKNQLQALQKVQMFKLSGFKFAVSVK
jgi:hypothetical protein